MFFSIFARGSITSRPQPVQRILKSSTAGVLFAGEDGIAHSNVHIVGRSLLPAGGQALYLRQTQLLRAAHTDIV